MFPFPDDSPLGRATRDPIAALALLAEAVSRGDKSLENYLTAANAAIKHANERGFIRLPEGEPAEVADVLAKPGTEPPHAIYERTGGGEPYRREMIRHGYVIVDGDVRCGAKASRPGFDQACRCLLKQGHEGDHMCPHGNWPA